MSLESIVFSSKKFQDRNESNKKIEAPKEKPAAWIDPDDLKIVINPKLRNFPNSEDVNAEEEISNVLREKYNQTVEHIDTSWAKPSNDSMLPEEVSANDLFASLKNQIPSNSLVIARVPSDLFQKQKQKSSILKVAFNPSEALASILDSKGCVHIVSVSEKKNHVQFSLPFPNEKPRYCQCYTANGEHIVVAGKHGSFLTIDCKTQQVNSSRVPDNQTDITQIYCSSDNNILAMIAGHYVHFFESSNKNLLKTIQTSDELKCGAFTDDSAYFVACGKDGRGLVFDLSLNISTICRFQEPEMQYIHAIDISRNRVAIGTEAGVLHIFDFDSLKTPFPKPLFSKMNLTTKVDSVKFNPTGEIVVFASSGKKDSLKILHVGAQKVFSNWPTQQTPLSYVRDVAFDQSSRFLAIGNDKGHVTLWELAFYAK